MNKFAKIIGSTTLLVAFCVPVSGSTSSTGPVPSAAQSGPSSSTVSGMWGPDGAATKAILEILHIKESYSEFEIRPSVSFEEAKQRPLAALASDIVLSGLRECVLSGLNKMEQKKYVGPELSIAAKCYAECLKYTSSRPEVIHYMTFDESAQDGPRQFLLATLWVVDRFNMLSNHDFMTSFVQFVYRANPAISQNSSTDLLISLFGQDAHARMQIQYLDIYSLAGKKPPISVQRAVCEALRLYRDDVVELKVRRACQDISELKQQLDQALAERDQARRELQEVKSTATTCDAVLLKIDEQSTFIKSLIDSSSREVADWGQQTLDAIKELPQLKDTPNDE
ncbi:MAG: hypothetical protein LBJ89_02140 [Holosporales bacterium]|nr:hypothetical protein [Holosporales bacterium]